MDYKQEFDSALEQVKSSLPSIAPRPGELAFTPNLAVEIARIFAEGTQFRGISQMSGMPPLRTLTEWWTDIPEFQEALRKLRKLRGFYYEQAAIEAAEDASGKDADRLRVETYKWAAEVNDPETYGPKRASHGEGGGVTVVVNTGWPDPPNEWQRPPTLGKDGLIEKRVVDAEFKRVEPQGDTSTPTNADASGTP